MFLDFSALFNCLASCRNTKAEITILTSYNTRIGIETITCVEISGGVITADITSTIISAYLRYLRKNCGVTKPILVKKYIIIGNSKITPAARALARTKPIYESISNSFLTCSPTVKLAKKFMESGAII